MRAVFVVILAWFAVSARLAAAEGGNSAWLIDYQQALAQAKKDNRGMMLDFTGSDWCSWCMKLKAEVFDTNEFKDWASKNLVLVEVDFPRSTPQAEHVKQQNQRLQQQFAIKGFPTIVFLGPDGKKIGEMGYEEGGPKPWIAHAVELMQNGLKNPEK